MVCFFFAQLFKLEARYNGDSDGEDSDSDSETGEGNNEDSTGNEAEEWFLFTTSLVNMAKNLGKQVEEITAMPYIKFLFWINYFKVKEETTSHNN